MPMRLQEVHPSLVHVPIALLPLTLAADTAGSLSGDRRLSWLGRWGLVATAASAALAGVAGLIAQEEVNVAGPSMDTLITHRNVNLGVLAVTTALAVRRATQESAGARYLAVGAGALGMLLYSAYLGGKVVYEYGVGVETAPGPRGGLWQGGGPEVTPRNAPQVLRSAAHDLGNGFRHLAQEVKAGKLAPSLFGGSGNGAGDGAAAPSPAGPAAAATGV